MQTFASHLWRWLILHAEQPILINHKIFTGSNLIKDRRIMGFYYCTLHRHLYSHINPVLLCFLYRNKLYLFITLNGIINNSAYCIPLTSFCFPFPSWECRHLIQCKSSVGACLESKKCSWCWVFIELILCKMEMKQGLILDYKPNHQILTYDNLHHVLNYPFKADKGSWKLTYYSEN